MVKLVDPRDEEFNAIMRERGIEVKGGDLHDLVNQLESLIADNTETGIFQRGGFLVEISDVPSTYYNKIKRSKGVKVIVPVKSNRVREIGTHYGMWVKYDARTDKNKLIDCPRDIATTLVERSSWTVPVLSGVISVPTITPDGRIISKEGYDEETGLYLDSEEWRKLDNNSSGLSVSDARALLLDIVSEFPFIDETAKAVWLSALFTSLLRWSLPTAPYFLFDAPVMASGKTLLATLIGLIASGAPPATMSQPKDETELRKGLLSALMAGDPILVIDNVEQVLSSETLCVVSTSPLYKDRYLGESKIVTVSTAVCIFFTGNNISVRGDLSTRVLISRLDPGVERPEERIFNRKNIKEFVLNDRQKIVDAVLTILKAYIDAGRPDTGLKPFGRFEEWDQLVRCPLVWSGIADPCESRSRVESSDPEREQLSELLLAWQDLYGDQEILIRTMMSDISSSSDEVSSNFRSILHAIAGEGSKINSRRLGRRIAHWEGRICEGLRIVRGVQIHKTQKWKLESIVNN